MSRFFKKIGVLLSAAVMSLSLFGCEKTKEEVKLKTAEQSKEYVSKNLPAASYEREEKGDDKITYIFKDELCGFEFEVVSEKGKSYFDATVVGYEEKTSDNWSKAYYDYLKGKVTEGAGTLISENGFKTEWSENIGLSTFMYIGTDKSIEELTPVLKELGAIAKAADKHGKLTGHEIWCSSGEDITKYDDVYAFYRFDTDEVLDKPAREAAVKN